MKILIPLFPLAYTTCLHFDESVHRRLLHQPQTNIKCEKIRSPSKWSIRRKTQNEKVRTHKHKRVSNDTMWIKERIQVESAVVVQAMLEHFPVEPQIQTLAEETEWAKKELQRNSIRYFLWCKVHLEMLKMKSTSSILLQQNPQMVCEKKAILIFLSFIWLSLRCFSLILSFRFVTGGNISCWIEWVGTSHQ